MEVIKKFPETMDARTQFKMMKSPEVKRMLDAEDSILEVKSWLLYREDSEYTVLTIETNDGEMFATVSESFRKAFDEIVAFFGDNVGALKVISGTSKAGRKYITCTVE